MAKPSKPKQGLLFGEVVPWEAADRAKVLVAEIALVEGPATLFSYSVPASLAEEIAVGKRVAFPFGKGNRRVTGYCVKLEIREPLRALKPILQVLDRRPLVSPEQLSLAQWMAERYLCSLGRALEAMVPAGVRGQAGTKEQTFLYPGVGAQLAVADPRLPAKQRKILEILLLPGAPLEPKVLAERAGCTQAPILTLRKRGLIEARHERMQVHVPERRMAQPAEIHQLNPPQAAAVKAILDAIQSQQPTTLLLHGVTGSGKTEVYIKAIEEVLAHGRQSIVLVPEISLTPQTRQRFESRFSRVAVLHSHLTHAERHAQWSLVERDQVDVVVGARSAVFAPAPRLGLLILDEEHEPSFKQEIAPRYHARDVAQERARLCRIPLVLGSATPCLETWEATQNGRFQLLSLPGRVADRAMPPVRIVDQRLEREAGCFTGLSRPLQQAMQATLLAGEQVILLLNRRGTSTHVQCFECGEPLKCKACDIALTLHSKERKLLCHYCEYAAAPPRNCPNCGRPGLNYGGLGTEKLEVEVNTRFPDHPCLRMDADTMRGPGAHERALERFKAGEIRILLGTQMIAKGLDFPRVTLVGVINADVGLHMADFRAAERTFQLLTQVSGRSGRGERLGRVLVQTYSPDHFAIQAAARHDFAAFCRQELPTRKAFGYPPYRSLARLIFRSPSSAACQAAAQEAVKLLGKCGQALAQGPGWELAPGWEIKGPAPPPVTRLRGKYRYHVLVLSESAPWLHQLLHAWWKEFPTCADVEWVVDVDPLEML